MPDGKIRYVEIPAIDVETSARFYSDVFGWNVGAGGRVRTASTPLGGGGEAFATFLEPAGNLVGVYQEARR